MISDLRFSGLASGMDTESIVKKLMQAERMPLNKVLQNKQWQEWQRDAYRDVNKTLLDFRGTMEKLRLNSTFLQSKVSSTDSTKLDVSRVGNPSLDSYVVSSVSLAEPARPASVKFAAVSNNLKDGNTKLSESISFTLSNGSGKTGTISLTENDTINTVIAKINSESKNTGVTAAYSQGDGRIIFTSTTTGDEADIIVGVDKGDTEFPSNNLGIVAGSIGNRFGLTADQESNPNDSQPRLVNGEPLKPGSVTINGMPIEVTSNTFTYDGMKFTLKAPTAENETITINKETDTEAIFNDIKSFVDKYNEVIKSLNDKLSEKKLRDFKPLLTEQKESMKEKEIELWEEKAKSGLLNNDSIISSVLMKMRSSLYTKVSGANTKFDTLSEIGITTSDNYRENGKFVLDEDKLKEAIANNLDDVKMLFTKSHKLVKDDTSHTTVTSSEKYENSGLAWRVYDQLNATMKEVTAKAGASDKVDNSILGKSIGSINDRIDAFERRLAQVENRYWKQFTAMEKAIQKANSQSSWLMQQMGGMGM